MDICVLNPFFYPYMGGTEKVIFEVYGRLSKRHNVTVITSAPFSRNRPGNDEIEGIRIVRLKTVHTHIPIFPMPFLFFDGLKKALVEQDADIYHINNRYQYFSDTVNSVRSIDKKLALTIHNALPQNIDPLTDKLGSFYDVQVWGRKLMREVDLITGVSTNTIKTTVPRSEMGKTHLVFNGVDYKKYRKRGRNNHKVADALKGLGFDGGTNIITNGRLVTQKGQIYLMKAVSELVNKDKRNLNLLLVGNGMLKRQLMLSAKELNIYKRMRIMYGIADDDLPYYYNACDIFSLPSLYEPAGLAVLEALSCELPSIVSRIGGLPEMVGDGGFYSRPKDYYSIKKKLEYVLDNRKIAEKVAKRGRHLMVKHHDWGNIAKRYEELFLKTIRY